MIEVVMGLVWIVCVTIVLLVGIEGHRTINAIYKNKKVKKRKR